MIKYNIDPEGYITEIGYVETYQYELEAGSPITMENFRQYKRVGDTWIKLTPEEYFEKYGMEL